MQSLEEENRVGARAPRGRRFGRRACMHAAPPAAFAVRCAATGHAAPHLLSVGRCSQLMAGQLKHFRNVLALSKGASDAYAAVAMRLGLAPGGTGAPAGVTAAPRAEAGGAVSPTPKPSAAGAAAPSRSKLAASKRGQVARARASGEDAQARPQSAPPGRDAQAARPLSASSRGVRRAPLRGPPPAAAEKLDELRLEVVGGRAGRRPVSAMEQRGSTDKLADALLSKHGKYT